MASMQDIPGLPRPAAAVGWALALVLTALVAACGGNQEQPPSADAGVIERLKGEPFQEVMAVALPSLRLEMGEGGLTVADAPGWSLSPLGQLIGQLDEAPSPEGATFFVVQGPAGQRLPGLDLPPGVFMALVGLDGQGQLEARGMAMLEEGLERIVPLALAGGLAPFRPGAADQEYRLSVTPALATDADGDGRQEMVLAWRQVRQTVAWMSYYVYQLQPGDTSWRRMGLEQGVPTLTVLDYWADLAAAIDIATRWKPETRLGVVWPWLVGQDSPLTADVLQKLAPGANSEEMDETQQALSLLHSFFSQAYARLSLSFRERLPWAAFVNGFRFTEGVMIESVGSPIAKGTGKAKVDVLLVQQNREGSQVLSRQFLVTVQLEMPAGRWYLDDMEAEEKAP